MGNLHRIGVAVVGVLIRVWPGWLPRGRRSSAPRGPSVRDDDQRALAFVSMAVGIVLLFAVVLGTGRRVGAIAAGAGFFRPAS
jgi:hypothetical protein